MILVRPQNAFALEFFDPEQSADTVQILLYCDGTTLMAMTDAGPAATFSGAYNHGFQLGHNAGSVHNTISVTQAEHPTIRLDIAKEASFDAAGRDHDPLCLPGTRTDLLQDVRAWLDSDSQKHIYWLSGWAGTGKSTIARTIAQEYINTQWQIGNFFFSKGRGDAGHIQKFVGTLATQLSYRWPAFKSALQTAISADEGIVSRTQKAQWTALILKPLSELLASPSSQRVLLVIDALDECGTDNDMNHIVELLLDARGVNQTALRIFVTSRPEVSIRNGFNDDLGQHHVSLVLHQISEFIVQHDLFTFLHHHFTKIRQSRRLGADWPGDANMNRLVEMSGNLFIWAATVCRFISMGGRIVKNRLSSILDGSNYSNGPQKALDHIYLMVVGTAIGVDLSEEEKAEVYCHLRHTLGTIAVLYSPLSVVCLGCLLGVGTEEIEQTLADLHSIVDVPSGTDLPVRLHHPSFRDFLRDQHRCRNDSLCVDSTAIHNMVAERCIDVMSALRRDICGLHNPGTMVEDVESAVIDQHISSALQYSCRYWLHHAEQGKMKITGGTRIENFIRAHLLFWLEAMILTNKFPEAVQIVLKLENLVQARDSPSLSSFVQDARSFVLAFADIIRVAPLQLYSSALFFSPRSSLVRKAFGSLQRAQLQVTTQLLPRWNVCLRTLEGHSDSVNSVMFSPDGCRVASVSEDKTVRVWDVQTGQCQHTLKGHFYNVCSVAFSYDGSRVVSGSADKTVRVWDMQTGQCQHTLEGHSGEVNSVAFSPDGSRVASSSDDTTVRVWDIQIGQCQHTLEGHLGWVNSVAFSPDGSRVASSSMDKTMRVWDVQTGQCQHTLEGYLGWVNSVVFSSDGSRVASSSADKTVRVWDIQTGQCQHTLEGHSGEVNSVAFSPDGSRVASSSDDTTVRVWDIQIGQCQHTLEGHSGWVNSVAFSPDGSRVASSSMDKTMRVWDVQTGQCQHTLEGHLGWVNSVVFSPDGSRVASSSADKTVRVWDIQTGQCQHTLEGHLGWVNSVVFSPDGSRVASSSADKTVRVWDIQTGQCQHTLEGHLGWVNSVVFSPDGSRVASSSADKTVRVWDIQTGQCQHTLEGRLDGVSSVVFSPDGSRVASSSADKTVRVWDIASSTEILCHNTSTHDPKIEFSHGSTKIVVNDGSMSISSTTPLPSTTAESPVPYSNLPVSKLEVRGDWVTLSSERILWLLPDYRPEKWASYHDTIVIGSSTGRVTFIYYSSTRSS